MSDERDAWAEKAKRHLKAEMVKSGHKHGDLARKLTDMGLPETEASVQVKINRGAFPAWFLFAAMKAMSVHTLRLQEAD